MAIKPRGTTYQMNLGNQKTALRILKEVTRSQPLDDSIQVQKLIERLKAELDILYGDLAGE
jgi:hypothetical protein